MSSASEQLRPAVANVGDRLARSPFGSKRSLRGHDELGAAVSGIGLTGHVAEPLKLIHEVDHGRLGEHGALGKLGHTRSRGLNVLSDGEQRGT